MQYEGVAYRGRVMVEVEMQLGQLPENSLEDVSDADLRRAVVSSYLRTYVCTYVCMYVCMYVRNVQSSQ